MNEETDEGVSNENDNDGEGSGETLIEESDVSEESVVEIASKILNYNIDWWMCFYVSMYSVFGILYSPTVCS